MGLVSDRDFLIDLGPTASNGGIISFNALTLLWMANVASEGFAVCIHSMRVTKGKSRRDRRQGAMKMQASQKWTQCLV